jgi:hypothetical protein
MTFGSAPIVFEDKATLDKYVADAVAAARRKRPLRERLQEAAPQVRKS